MFIAKEIVKVLIFLKPITLLCLAVFFVLRAEYTFSADCKTNKWGIKFCTPTDVKDVGNVIQKAGDDVAREGKAAGEYIKESVQGYLPPGFSEYVSSLERQADGKWKKIPDSLRRILQPHYKIDLGRIRYAENINTGHGQGITFGYDVYFPSAVDLWNPEAITPTDREVVNKIYGDTAWLAHEIEHSVQYATVGGVVPFMSKYFAGGLANCLSYTKDCVTNIHDSVPTERDAENKSLRVMNIVWNENERYPGTANRQTFQEDNRNQGMEAQRIEDENQRIEAQRMKEENQRTEARRMEYESQRIQLENVQNHMDSLIKMGSDMDIERYNNCLRNQSFPNQCEMLRSAIERNRKTSDAFR